MTTANNITELKAIDTSGDFDTPVLVLGYYSPNDGGGGWYNHCADCTCTDNGGTVISPDSGPGRWVRQANDMMDVRCFGAKGDNAQDDTDRIQACLTACKGVFFPEGTFRITDHLNLSSGQTVTCSAGTVIRQDTFNINIFRAYKKSDICLNFNGAILHGYGVWSALWTGNESHEDRAIRLYGCQRVTINNVHTRNCGNAGISIQGGSDILISFPVIEGTNDYDTPLPLGSNFQNGIHIFNLLPEEYGNATNIRIVSPDISGTCQGVLREEYDSDPATGGSVTVTGANIHDVPGQHGFYIQGGKFTIVGATLTNVAGSGVKVQSGGADSDISGFVATGINAENIGVSLFEVATLGAGSLGDYILSGTVIGCEYGISINGKCRYIRGQVIAHNVSNVAAYITGSGPAEIDLDIYGDNIEDDGVLVDATNTGRIRISPVIRQCNTAENGNGSGVRVESASALVELYNPDISDADGKMKFGLFNSILGSIVKVRGSARFIGAIDKAVRATGLITEFPTDNELGGANGDFEDRNTIMSSQPMLSRARSVSASYVVAWARLLDDESCVAISAEICGRKSGSSERAAYTSKLLVYRDGGGATIQGSPQTLFSEASGSFGGSFMWDVSGNSVFLKVSSGSASDYEWTVRVSCEKS